MTLPAILGTHWAKKSLNKNSSARNGPIVASVNNISVRFGPVQNNDIKMEDADDVRGASKRKARTSVGQKKSYVEPESSEDEDKPLVRCVPYLNATLLPLGFCS